MGKASVSLFRLSRVQMVWTRKPVMQAGARQPPSECLWASWSSGPRVWADGSSEDAAAEGVRGLITQARSWLLKHIITHLFLFPKMD